MILDGVSSEAGTAQKGSTDRAFADTFLVSEVTEVNNILVRLQTLNDAARALLAKRCLWTTRSRRTEIEDEDSVRTDHVSRYLSERKASMDRYEKVSIISLAGRRRRKLSPARYLQETRKSSRTLRRSDSARRRNGLGSPRG